ncbi:hypothetical protein BDR26DRAFT_849154 [Obelidium mucronatum]|nr:hypothetical protein BDR26DRAFT_849154 [Obelidium mucronatum]
MTKPAIKKPKPKSSEELESKSFEEEEESFAPKSKVELEARERTASKKRVESAKLTKTKKAPTPKSASGTRSSNSRGSRSEKFQRRLQMKLDNDGFSAMGLSEADELPSSHTSKSDTHKRSSNQPAPPPHYLTATAAIPTTKKSTPPGNPGKAVLSRNPSSRRKAIKTLAYGAMGDNRHHASRFGHYDSDDRRSKSMDPGEYRNRTSRQRMASDFANGHGVSDENDENIQDLERRAVYNGNRANQANDESNSNSSQEYRYSDRISGKYNSGEPAKNFGESAAGNLQKMPDRLMLSSSALKAAQDQGMVSPETRKPLEQAPTGSLTDTRFQGGSQARMGNSEPNLKQQLGGRDDDQPRGRVLFSKKAQPMGQRESIMDDEPKRKTFGSKNLPAKPPVRKTRVTVVSKPKKLAPKKAEAKPLEGGKNTMAPSLAGPNGGIGYWPQGGPSSFMGGFPQFGFNGQPSYIQQQQYPPPFMQHPQQAPLPSLQALQLTAPQFTPPPPTVHPGLVPARIKLTTVPVVTFKQSYEMGMDSNGGILTYISSGSFPSQSMDMSGGGGFMGYPGGNNPGYDNGFESQRQIATATTLRSMGEIRGAKPGPKSRAAGGGVAESGVRSMIKKGVIGRSTTTARGNYR